MDIGSLAVLAADTLVTASVTDAWETTKSKVSRVFGRGEPDPATERRLDATRKQLLAVPTVEAEQVRAALAERWAARLADLLDDNPEAEPLVRAMISEIRAGIPEGTAFATDHSLAVSGNVTITAEGGSVAAGVIHGNVMPPGPSGPRPVNALADPARVRSQGQDSRQPPRSNSRLRLPTADSPLASSCTGRPG